MKKLIEKLKGLKEKNVKSLLPAVVSFVVFIAAIYNHPVNAEHLTNNIDEAVHTLFIIVGAIGSLIGIFSNHTKK